MGASFGTLFTPEKLQLLLATPASTPFSTTIDLHFFVPTLSWVPFRQGKARRSAYPCCLRHHETNKQNHRQTPERTVASRRVKVTVSRLFPGQVLAFRRGVALGPSQVYKENPLDTLFTSQKLKMSWLQDPSRPFSPRKNLMLRMGAGFGTLFTQEKLKISRLQDPSRPFSPRESFMFLMGASFGTLFTPEKLQFLLATPASTPFSTTLDLHFFVPTLSWFPFR